MARYVRPQNRKYITYHNDAGGELSQAIGSMDKNLVKIVRMVQETDIHTHRCTHCNTSQPLLRAKWKLILPKWLFQWMLLYRYTLDYANIVYNWWLRPDVIFLLPSFELWYIQKIILQTASWKRSVDIFLSIWMVTEYIFLQIGPTFI